MNPEEFVSAIKLVVEKAGNSDMMSNLIEFPNNINNEKKKILSHWFNTLNAEGKEYVEQIVAESISTAIFGFFCVLDGVRVIEKGYEKGDLKLYYVKGQESVLITDPGNSGCLHDLYNTKD